MTRIEEISLGIPVKFSKTTTRTLHSDERYDGFFVSRQRRTENGRFGVVLPFLLRGLLLLTQLLDK